MAGKLFIAKNYKINKNFGEVSRNAFQSEFQNIDFDHKEAAANEINQWVRTLSTEEDLYNYNILLLILLYVFLFYDTYIKI